MNQSELDAQIAELQSKAEVYQPGQRIHEVLKGTIFVPIIGPFAVGKTTYMHAIERIDPDFGRVTSFTTRPQRDAEPNDTYQFLSHDSENLAVIRNMMDLDEVVEVAVHLETNYVYGSHAAAFSKSFSMLDTLANTVEHLSALPFGRVHKIGLITPPQDWWRRVMTRQETQNALKQRMAEAHFSLEWLLDQTDDITLVLNSDNELRVATEEIITSVRHAEHHTRNRKHAEALLRFITEKQNL